MPYVDPAERRAKDAAYKRARRLRDREGVRAAEKRYRETHIEQIRAAERARDAAQPQRVCAERQARRARLKGVRVEPYDRVQVFEAYDNRCVYCFEPATHLDHVIPVARGGADALDNVAPACAACNLAKGAKPLLVWMCS